MKLKNKRTGEIGELHYEPDKEYHFTVATEDPADMMIFKTLAELNSEWEDYEEPKEYWYIENNGDIDKEIYDGDNYEERMIEIGNYFGTLEEADKAVEQLKAWKRLKDKGFRFSHHSFLDRTISYKVPVADEKIGKDLDLLFGGEE